MANNSPSNRLTLTLDFPEITLDKLSRVAGLWASLVQTVSAQSTGKKQAVRWVITEVHYGSSLTVETRPEVHGKRIEPALLDTISRSVIDGMRHLTDYPDAPEFFSPHALSLAKKLAQQADNERGRIIVSNGTDTEVALNAKIISTVDTIFGPVVQSLGSVEGTLEGVITHGKHRFYIYDSLAGRRVSCLFGERITLDRVLHAYGKRVSVSGVIRTKERTGERLSIEASELIEFTPDDELLSTDDILREWGGVQ